MKYDPLFIENKWQKFWLENKTFQAEALPAGSKYYILDMFPYPSGAGLHVGHLIGYTATDILARYKRAAGFSVLHPMGWDSFGLPAEQYAIRTGTHPAITTHINIKNFKSQLNALGYSYDWDREIMTSDPKYYKWTQWIFTRLLEKGLAYQADMMVNWCPILGTVLANEEIENGRAKEGGYPIERRPLKQWVLKITAYAERLLEDLEGLDWPEGLKKLQKNWIGKSEGAVVEFPIEGSAERISVFTTRHDTIFGVTYLVLSPEHPFIDQVNREGHKEAIKAYQKKSAAKSDLERSELAKEKTGVFTGGFALNPATGEKIPIWIADYVLMGYGTGAVMAVPAHDSRDDEFVQVFGLPKIPVYLPDDEEMKREVLEGTLCFSGDGTMINSQKGDLNLNGLRCDEAKERVINWLEKKGFGKRTVNYKLRDWLFSRQRYWGEPFPILHFADGSIRSLELDELPLIPPEVSEYKPCPSGESPLAKVREWVEIEDPKTGHPALRETNTMPQWAGSCWYYLRFLDPTNDEQAWALEKERAWMPIDLYVGGAEHAVLHLLYARFWHKVLFDLDLVSTKEPFQRLCNQGMIVARAFQREGGTYVPPSEVVERNGRFYHWETEEELRSQFEKMSKSKLNGVSPDEVIEEFGADALRLYCMFMGPIDKEKIWNTDSVNGCRRFLNRFFEIATSEKLGESEEGLPLAHKLVEGVTHDLEHFLLNTAISKMMEFVNNFTKLPVYSKQGVILAVQILAPFAPHMAEELWQHLGQKGSVIRAPWPKADPRFLITETVTYVVQVNGKVRARFDLPEDETQESVLEQAQNNENVAKYLTGEVVKVIFVPNKLLNIVIK
ncbi:MAG: leucine--tRNA ligase [Chlamydiales bacterium]